MTSKERLMAAITGKPVDRTPVSFYEIDGYQQQLDNDDRFNIYNDPSWRAVVELAREESDSTAWFVNGMGTKTPAPLQELTTHETWTDEAGSRFSRMTIRAGKRTLTSLARRDPDVNTVWAIEHLLKDVDDFKAYLELPEAPTDFTLDITPTLDLEKRVGDGGIVVQDAVDPVCCVASLFDMGTWTIMAMTEPELIRRALDRFHRTIMARLTTLAPALPGRLWRVVGPEYAGEPYMPPSLFREYVTPYDREIVECIHAAGGYARIHCHGRLRNILDDIVATGCDAIDPIEPPHQGDIELHEVRDRYGDRLALFGNIETSDIENLPPPEFAKKVETALREGPGKKGFVLMPSACPCGRAITPTALANYRTMIDLARRG